MMRIVIGTLLSLTIGVGAALAQAPATTPSTAPAAAPAKMSPDDKKAISKACSDQATAKGLHGKERKKFRSECKRHAAKPS
jgi:hypothetical protein